MIFDLTQTSSALNFILGWAAGFLIVFWISLVFWTVRDIRSRTGSVAARFLAALLVLFFFLPGLLIYLILRPRRTLEDEYQQTLEEEALLQSVEEAPDCPGCGRRIREDWLICPGCHTKLRKVCENCGRLMDLPWNMCPYCATPTADLRTRGEDGFADLPSSMEINIDDALVNFDIMKSQERDIADRSKPGFDETTLT